MLDRLLSLFVALSLALLVWLYARSRDQEVLDHVPVPVVVTLPTPQNGQYSVEIVGAAEVLATFTGSPSRLREVRGLLQREELRVELNYAVPPERVADLRVDETLSVDVAELHTPSGVTASLIPGRNQVRVILRRLGERRLPVRFDHSFEPPLGPVTIDPPTVLVRGPQEILQRLTAIPTQPWILPSARRTPGLEQRPPPAARVPLVSTLDKQPVQCEPAFVSVRASPQPLKVYDIADVPVRFLCPDSYTLRPRFDNDRAGRISLRVEGPLQDEPPRVYAFVDLTGKLSAQPGFYAEPIQIQLPKDFRQVDAPTIPPRASFELIATEAVPNKGLGGDPPPP
jgi:hypothetical protein